MWIALLFMSPNFQYKITFFDALSKVRHPGYDHDVEERSKRDKFLYAQVKQSTL